MELPPPPPPPPKPKDSRSKSKSEESDPEPPPKDASESSEGSLWKKSSEFVPPPPPPPMPKVSTPDDMSMNTPPPAPVRPEDLEMRSSESLPIPAPPPLTTPSKKGIEKRNSTTCSLPIGPPPESSGMFRPNNSAKEEPPEKLPVPLHDNENDENWKTDEVKNLPPPPPPPPKPREDSRSEKEEENMVDPAPPPPGMREDSKVEKEEEDMVDPAPPPSLLDPAPPPLKLPPGLASMTSSEIEMDTSASKEQSRDEETVNLETIDPPSHVTADSPSVMRPDDAIGKDTIGDVKEADRNPGTRRVSIARISPEGFDSETKNSKASSLSLARHFKSASPTKENEDDPRRPSGTVDVSTPEVEVEGADLIDPSIGDEEAVFTREEKEKDEVKIPEKTPLEVSTVASIVPPGLERAVDEAHRNSLVEEKSGSLERLKEAFNLSVSATLIDDLEGDADEKIEASPIDHNTLEDEFEASDHLLAAERALVRVEALHEKERARKALFDKMYDEMASTNDRLRSDVAKARAYFDGLCEEVDFGKESLRSDSATSRLVKDRVDNLRDTYLQIRRSKDILTNIASNPRKCRRSVMEMEKQIKRYDSWNSEVSRALESVRMETRHRVRELNQSPQKIVSKKKQHMHHLRVARDGLVALKLQERKRAELSQKANAVHAIKTDKKMRRWKMHQRAMAEKLVEATSRERRLRNAADEARKKLREVDSAAADLAAIHRNVYLGLQRIIDDALVDDFAINRGDFGTREKRTIAPPTIATLDRTSYREGIASECRRMFAHAFDDLANQIVRVRRETAKCWESLVDETSRGLERDFRDKLTATENEIQFLDRKKRDLNDLIGECQTKVRSTVRQLSVSAKSELKQRRALKLKARIRKLWRERETPLRSQLRLLETFCFFDEGSEGSMKAACDLVSRMVSKCRIELKICDYDELVKELRYARDTLIEATSTASSSDSLQQRLARQSLQQHWDALRQRAMTCARAIKRTIGDWQDRWERTFYCASQQQQHRLHQRGGRRRIQAFLDTAWRDAERVAGTLPGRQKAEATKVKREKKAFRNLHDTPTPTPTRRRYVESTSPSLSSVKSFISRHRNARKIRSYDDDVSFTPSGPWSSSTGVTKNAERRWFRLPGSDKKVVLPTLDDVSDEDVNEEEHSYVTRGNESIRVKSVLQESLRAVSQLKESNDDIDGFIANLDVGGEGGNALYGSL